jgi:hypothetical protein
VRGDIWRMRVVLVVVPEILSNVDEMAFNFN